MFSTKRVFVAACAGMLLFGMAILSLGAVNAFLAQRFAPDELGMGLLAALLPLGIVSGSLVFGPVVDRFGYKLPLALASFLLLVGFLFIAESPSLTTVRVAFFQIGFGGGVLNGGTNALVADISGERRSARLSLLGVFYGAGALGMPALTGLLLNLTSYEGVIRGLALAVLIPLAMILLTRFPPPKQGQGFPLREGLTLLHDRTLLLLSMILFFESGAEGLVNNWSPSFFLHREGFSTGWGLLLLTVLGATITLTRLVLGAARHRIHPRKVLFAFCGAAMAGAVLLATSRGEIPAIAAMIFIGVGFSGPFPIVLAQIGELFPTLSGTAFGIALVIGLTGNAAINYVLGLIAQTFGMGAFPAYLAADLAWLGVFLWLAFRSFTRRRLVS
jgi:FHS family glucose/mannose:H+ symporter-like MFS transporter